MYPESLAAKVVILKRGQTLRFAMLRDDEGVPFNKESSIPFLSS